MGYIKSKSVKPVEQVYLQIALLYRALASDEKEEGHLDKASQALEESKKYLEQLLELQPDETLRLEALYALQVLLPIANDKSEDETLPRVEAFLKDHPDSELAYLTRAEIFHNRVLNGQTDWCDQTKADYDHALQLINKQLDEADQQARLSELDPRGPQILYETFVPFLTQEKEVAERQLKALKC
ncbi:hypothetical protein HYR54_09160 [Candidatus Acetothermia bacterium]|nr:hypothetical protein [Candidatus Acetothermia bacterium]MBI3460981.1 hypothetical protein [Candidatus Acetothermia bacterium]